ncbi:ATP-binding cassette domain-containing protein, partial [Pandoraea sputorum]
CGKSTLLKTIAGFVLPREGRIVLENADVSQLPVHRKIRQCGVGFVPQTDNVFGTLTIRENLQVGGHYLSDSER